MRRLDCVRGARHRARARRARAGRRDREGDREIPRDAQGGPLEQSGLPRCRPRRGAVDHRGRPEERHARAMRPRQGPGQGRGRLRRTAALFRRRRPRDGCRDAAVVVHGEAAGHQRGRLREAPASGRRPAGEGDRRDCDLRGQQVGGAEVRRAKLDAPQGARGRSRSARRCSTAAPGRSISPAPPATPIRACASACRACPISPRRRRRAR